MISLAHSRVGSEPPDRPYVARKLVHQAVSMFMYGLSVAALAFTRSTRLPPSQVKMLRALPAASSAERYAAFAPAGGYGPGKVSYDRTWPASQGRLAGLFCPFFMKLPVAGSSEISSQSRSIMKTPLHTPSPLKSVETVLVVA